jgi:hypothetical protein
MNITTSASPALIGQRVASRAASSPAPEASSVVSDNVTLSSSEPSALSYLGKGSLFGAGCGLALGVATIPIFGLSGAGAAVSFFTALGAVGGLVAGSCAYQDSGVWLYREYGKYRNSPGA